MTDTTDRTPVVLRGALAEVLRRPGWHRRAACRGVGPAVFFPEAGNRRLAQAAAGVLCAQCPVRAPCANAGMAEVEGIWGGAEAEERLRWRADPAVLERASLA
ncbi:MAG TPA: WhiB family transcriptional regulator [Acidimicrobiales bacterium]|nr:WhiB family transcriptional regulator [Acidimicrobiales bacterium]